MAIVKSGTSGFGIKEVADVGFYKVEDVTYENGKINILNDPLFILDTLKVSTIENTAEQTEARGGKGNASLIIWDHSREVNITLQDAVLTMQTLSLMFENGIGTTGDNEITISANTFPGTYAIIGKTFARNVSNGEDHLFTWYVPKAKVTSEVTITMEAEGDPTVFDMNLRVLRSENGVMVRMIRDADALEGEYKVEAQLGKTSTTD